MTDLLYTEKDFTEGLYHGRGEEAETGQTVSVQTHMHARTHARAHTHTQTELLNCVSSPKPSPRWAEKLDVLSATAMQDPEGFL